MELKDAAFERELAIVAREMERPPYNHPEKGADNPLTKAIALIRAGKVGRLPDGTYSVEGKTRQYTCSTECSCPQSQKGKSKWCYHLIAAAAYKEVCARAGTPTLPLGPSTPDEHLAQSRAAGPKSYYDVGSETVTVPAHVALQSTISPPDESVAVSTPEPIQEAPRASQEPMMSTPTIADPFIPEPTPEPTPTPMQDNEAATAALDAWYGQPVEPSYVAHDRIERSPQVGVLMAALARAQAHMTNPGFDSANPHFRNRYASLAAVRDAVTPALTAEGIALTQLPSSEDGWVSVTTGLWHASGQYLCSTLRLPVPKGDPQGYGSALTYARRYGLQAICNVAGDEDDDAESLRGKEPGKAVAQGQKPAMPDNPVLRQEIAKALKALGFQGTTKAEYEAEVQRRTGLALVPEHFGTILEKLRTAVDTQAA